MARTGLKYVAKIWRKKLKSYFPRKIPEFFCYLLIIHWIIHITFVNLLRNQKFGALHVHSFSSCGEVGRPSSLAGSKGFYQIFLSIRFFVYKILCLLELLSPFIGVRYFFFRYFVLDIFSLDLFHQVFCYRIQKNRLKICISQIFC